MKAEKIRCGWCIGSELYENYHDHEWGVPVHDDHQLFEMLILEGAQAGLSWITVLKKRERYREVFAHFDPKIVANFDEGMVEMLLQDPGIIRNKLKVNATVINAKAFLAIQKEFGSFDNYIWAFVNHQPIIHQNKTLQDVPAKTELSDTISKDLKKRGFKFVGSTIIYAFMQAVGMVNDHVEGCYFRSLM